MKIRYLLCLLLAGPFALAQDGPALNPNALLKELKQIQADQGANSKKQFGKIVQDFTAASSSNQTAISFYLEAVRATQFMGKGHEQSEFMEWKKKQNEKIAGADSQIATRLHLVYLVLSLQRANGSTVAQLLPGLLNYVDGVSSNWALVHDEEMMKKSINDSIFVHWYGVGSLLDDLKDWETTPGNTEGIWQKTILPEMRLKRDPRVIAYWDSKLQEGAKSATQTGLVFNAEQFNLTRKPALLWSRAKDFIAIGQRNNGIAAMFDVVKNFPHHPDAGAWINELQGLLSPPTTAAPATPAVSGSVAAPAVVK